MEIVKVEITYADGSVVIKEFVSDETKEEVVADVVPSDEEVTEKQNEEII